jgi:cation transport regulator ChaB
MAWQDGDGGKLEKQLTEIAVHLVLTAEIRYRERAIRQYQWRVDRKAELEEEERQHKLAPSAQRKNGKNGSSKLESTGSSGMRQHFSKPAR